MSETDLGHEMQAKPKLNARVVFLILAVGLLLVTVLVKTAALSSIAYAFELDLTVLGGGASRPEILQDLIGMRGLVAQTSSYPVLGAEFNRLGIQWQVEHQSTHPPTAFLFVAPFAWLPLPVSTAVWAWIMVALLFSTLLCYSYSWKAALALMPILLLWPPIALSLEQLTIIWMWGIAVAWRLGRDRPFWGGIGIAIAALTKLLPALVIVVFLFRKKWTALFGFLAVWIIATLILLGFNPSVISEYLLSNRTNSPDMIARTDNASLLVNVYRLGGIPLSILALACLVLLLLAHKRFFQTQAAIDSLQLWMLFSFLSVALLPVAWIYSIAPLLPVILFLMRKGKWSTISAAFCGFLLPCLVPPLGDITVLPLTVATVSIGIGLVFDALPWKPFTLSLLEDITPSVTPSG